MKKILLLISAVAITINATAQITLTADNYPVWGSWNLTQAMSQVSLNPANNGTYDLTTTTAALVSPLEYQPETIPYFTDAGIDVFYASVQPLTSGVGYARYSEYDHNTLGLFEAGHDIYAQGYSLESFTGSNLDSLIIPAQRQLYANPRPFIKFPATAGDNWAFEMRVAVDFNLTVAGAGLNNVAGQHVFTVVGADSIVGWGQMRVPGFTGISDYFNVLIKKNTQYTIDSMYLGGQPAAAPIMSAFNMTQGQITGERNRYFVLRADYSTPLAQFIYPNSSFTNANAIYFDTYNLTGTGIADADMASEATLMYPNPVNGGELNLQVFNLNRQFVRYAIIDLQGRIVQEGGTTTNGGLFTFATAGLTNGQYVLRLIDNQGEMLNERFNVQR
jgi:hypothetical protein